MATVDCGFEGRPEELVQSGPTIVVQIGFDPKYLTFSQYQSQPAEDAVPCPG